MWFIGYVVSIQPLRQKATSLLSHDHDSQDEGLLMPVEEDNISLINQQDPKFSVKLPSQSLASSLLFQSTAKDSIVLISSSFFLYPCESQNILNCLPQVIQHVLGEARTRTHISLMLQLDCSSHPHQHRSCLGSCLYHPNPVPKPLRNTVSADHRC